jgi:hypothetical protein
MTTPIFSFSDLITPTTRQQVQASFYEVYGILGLRVSSWKEGAVVRTWTVAASIALAAFSELQASIARTGFLEFAEGPWLDAVAHYVYGLDRIEATFATGEVTLVNSGGGEYAFDPEDLIVRNLATNKTYRNTAYFEIAAAQTVTASVRATEAGAASTSGALSVTDIVTTVLQVTCSNLLALTGRDAETDQQLRTRCGETLGALSPFGPWDAYSAAVRNATRPDGSTLGITRIRPVKDGYGNVTVYCASATGAILGDSEDPETDLGIANDAVQRSAAPLAVTADTVSATALSVAVTYEVWMYSTSGRTDAQIKEEIESRLGVFMVGQPIGGNRIGVPGVAGKVYVDAIRSVIASSWPQIFHVVVTTPAADVECSPFDVPVSAAVVATAIHQIAPADGVIT